METDQLWGGQLTSLELDFINHTVAMAIDTNNGGLHDHHRLLMSEVNDFHFFSNIEPPWNYAEFTEMYFGRIPKESSWKVEIVLWSENAGITLKCARVELNGKVVLGEQP